MWKKAENNRPKNREKRRSSKNNIVFTERKNMRKSEKIILALCIIIRTFIRTELYSSLILDLEIALAYIGSIRFMQFHHKVKAENIALYRKIKRHQPVALKYKRKIHLRNFTGYTAGILMITSCFTASYCAILFRVDTLFVRIFTGTAIVQYIIAATISAPFLIGIK